MRFELNEILFGIFFRIDENYGSVFYRTPLLYNDLVPTKIHFMKLEVKEHHRVPGEWDSETVEPKHDGYVLKGEDDKTYHNQYPRASYGQVSDDGDRRFNLKQKLSDKPAEFQVYSYHLLTDAFNNINKGIEDLEQVSEPERLVVCLAKVKQLVELRDRIVKEFHETYPEYHLSFGKETLIDGDDFLFHVSRITPNETMPS